MVKFAIKQTMKAQRGEKKYSCTLYLTSAIDGVGWSTPRPGRHLGTGTGTGTGTIAQDAGWAPELVWTGAQNLAPSGFDHQSWKMNVQIYAPATLRSNTVLSTCATRTPGGTLRVSSSKQNYFEIITVSQLNFKDIIPSNRIVL